VGHGEGPRGLRARTARRIGRFLGVSDLFKAVDELQRQADAQQAGIDACRALMHELHAQLSSARTSHPELWDGNPPERSRHPRAVGESRAGTAASPGRWTRRFARTTGREPFQTLWVGPRLSALERLSLTSFLDHGHDVHLYTYESVDGVPDGVRCFDAREILGEDRVFWYGAEAGPDVVGGVSGFSELFRFKLLRDRGGWWFDADVVCLRPFDFRQSYCFALQDESLVNCALVHVPKNSKLMKALFQRAEAKVSNGNLKWLDIGPPLFTEVIAESGLEHFVLPAPVFYTVHWQHALTLFEEDPDGAWWSRLDGPYSVHFWNELIRRNGLNKDAHFPAMSVFERLKRRHGI
jgi:hypothetical protein